MKKTSKFKLLERHGHSLQSRHGQELKCHIRFDDDERDLVLEVKLPGEESWTRLSPQFVRDIKRSAQADECHRMKDRLMTNQTGKKLATGANALPTRKDRNPSLPT